MEVGLAILGWGVRRPYIIDLLDMRICQGNIREFSGEKMCQSVGNLSAFPLVQFYGAGTVLSLLQLESHIYVNKPTRY